MYLHNMLTVHFIRNICTSMQLSIHPTNQRVNTVMNTQPHSPMDCAMQAHKEQAHNKREHTSNQY